MAMISDVEMRFDSWFAHYWYFNDWWWEAVGFMPVWSWKTFCVSPQKLDRFGRNGQCMAWH